MNYSYLSAQKLFDIFTEKLSTIRTGRVNASILDTVLVEAYGSKMHCNEIATITTPEAGQLLITPFDKSLLPALQKAITDSRIGANPVNDGIGVRLVFPPLTEENKKLRVKEIAVLLEEVKIMLRNARHDALKKIKHQKDEGEISEDELRRNETDLQKEVDAINKELDIMAQSKEAELMKV